ncbi:hypothetical protein [Microcoleus sp. FACHB-672]|nr:hypothetical protein [Microcoleus sp. FACHB-672]
MLCPVSSAPITVWENSNQQLPAENAAVVNSSAKGAWSAALFHL